MEPDTDVNTGTRAEDDVAAVFDGAGDSRGDGNVLPGETRSNSTG